MKHTLSRFAPSPKRDAPSAAGRPLRGGTDLGRATLWAASHMVAKRDAR